MTQTIDWQDDDLWNLLNLSNGDIYKIYDHLESDTIRRQANKYRKLLRLGLIEMPERLTPYTNPEDEKAAAAERRDRVARGVGKAASKLVRLSVPEEHIRYHQALQEALDQEGALTKARFSHYQSLTKNNEGEAEIHDLHAEKFEVKFDSEPEWPIPTRVESGVRRKKEAIKSPDGIERTFIFSDLQIPFQDLDALEIALQVMVEVKPDKVIFVGDLLDLSAWSKYEQQPEWATATQESLIQAHQLLSTVRKTLPSATIQVIESNHEIRMPKTLLHNAKAAYGLKRADQLDGWPVMSVPYLLAMDTLDVDWIPGYPANRIYLSPDLQVIHGTITTKGAAAKRTSAAEKISTIFGHDHRLSMNSQTVNTYDGGKQLMSYGSGCLCRIDGHVPSVKRGLDLDGTPIRNLEDWSQGFIVASYMPNGGPFHVEQVAINTLNQYETMFRGKIYKPKPSDNEIGYA